MRQLYSGIDKKFFGDTAWNYLAFSVMALTGILLNFLIAWKSGIESLGVFNQIYAVYVILGQLAVLASMTLYKRTQPNIIMILI